MASRKGTLLPKWLQGNNGHLSINSYTKLENRRDYVAPTPYKSPPIVNKVAPINSTNLKRKLLNTSRGYDQPSNAINPPTVNTPRKIVQQGKVPIKGLQRPNNPFAPALVNFANTASLGLLEANNKGIQQLHQQSPISSTIGSMAGYVMPYGIGSKLARPITSKFVKPLAKKLIEGAMVGSGVELASGVIGQRGVKQTTKNVAIGGVLGAVGDVALHGAGKLIGKGIKSLKAKPQYTLDYLNRDSKGRLNNGLLRSITQPLGFKASFRKPKIEAKIETPQNVLYHGTRGKFEGFNPSEDLYLTGDKEYATTYVNTKNGGQMVHTEISPKAKILDTRTVEGKIEAENIIKSSKAMNYNGLERYKTEHFNDDLPMYAQEEFAELAKQKGYDGLIVSERNGINSTRVFNKDVVKTIKTEDLPQAIKPINTTVKKDLQNVDDINLTIDELTEKHGSMMRAYQIYDKLHADAFGKNPLKATTNNLKVESANTPIVNKKLPTDTLQPPNTKVSQFKTNTLKNSEFLADKETQKVIDNIAMEYEVKPNVQTVNRAMQEVNNDFDGVMNRIKNTEIVSGQGALNSAEDSAASALITNKLRLKAKETGNYTELKAWLEVLQPKVTNTAQSLQALKTWKDLSPEGTIFKAQQTVGEVNRAGEKLYGKNFKPIELTTDEIKHIGDSMEDVIKMPETTPGEIKAKERAFAKVKKVIGDKIPATIADKVKALQRISLLLNPKTNVRNVLGNTILNTLENTKDVISAPLDKLVSLKTGNRTTLLPSLKGLQTQGKGMVKGFKTVIGDIKQGVNTSQSVGQFDITGDRIFKNKALNKLEQTTNTALRFGDEPFYQAAYDESLRQQLKIAKVTKPTKDMLEKAKLSAQDRTLQNNSQMVESFKKVQQALNFEKTGEPKKFGLGNIVLPFAKTPANILDKAIDYTPLGSLKAISQVIGTKKIFNQKLFVDRIGRSVVGTGGIALGYDLAKNGMITGNFNKDKDVAAMDRQTGKSPYSFVSGNTYKTFDWAAPASIMLAIGADLYYGGKDRKDMANVAVEALKSGGTTLLNQSLLQGIQRMFGYNDLIGGISASMLNAPTQFVPTALKQASQLKDSVQRDTYNADPLKKLGNQIKAKLPLMSEKLPPKIDTLGRDVKQFQGKNNAFNVLINPGFTTKNVANDTEKFVTKLYNETGLKTHFPKVASDKIIYKADSTTNKTISLTPTEKVQFQKYIGQRTNKEFEVIAKTYTENEKNNRTTTSATQQVKDLGSLLTDIYTDGEKKILEARGIKEWNSKTYGKTLGNNPRN